MVGWLLEVGRQQPGEQDRISLIDILQGGRANEALACRPATRGVLPSYLTLYTAFTLIYILSPLSLSLSLSHSS